MKIQVIHSSADQGDDSVRNDEIRVRQRYMIFKSIIIWNQTYYWAIIIQSAIRAIRGSGKKISHSIRLLICFPFYRKTLPFDQFSETI